MGFVNRGRSLAAAVGALLLQGISFKNMPAPKPGVHRVAEWKRGKPGSLDSYGGKHTGKGRSAKTNRRQLGISARQQRRFRKLARGLPRHSYTPAERAHAVTETGTDVRLLPVRKGGI